MLYKEFFRFVEPVIERITGEYLLLTSLTIQNFKGIASCDLKDKDLARINLLVGKNDSGKSTIMEVAYYIFQELYAPPKLPQIMSRRTNVFCGGSELWFRYKMESPIVISVSFDSLEFEWRIATQQGGRYINSTFSQMENTDLGKMKRIVGGTTYVGRDFSMTSSGSNIINIMRADAEVKETLAAYASNASFIDCYIKSKTTEIERILARFKISGGEQKFGEILNDIYGKGKEWEFMPQVENPDEKRLAIREAGQLKYFSAFGDGLRCCVGILGTAMSMRNTALFVEEIESHQHSGALSKLIRHLVNIARENNLQIFLSTHSKDVWEALSRGVYKEDTKRQKEEFRCLLIERDPETGKVTAESTDDLQKITSALE